MIPIGFSDGRTFARKTYPRRQAKACRRSTKGEVDVTEKARTSLVHSVPRTQAPSYLAALPRRSEHPRLGAPAPRSHVRRLAPCFYSSPLDAARSKDGVGPRRLCFARWPLAQCAALPLLNVAASRGSSLPAFQLPFSPGSVDASWRNPSLQTRSPRPCRAIRPECPPMSKTSGPFANVRRPKPAGRVFKQEATHLEAASEPREGCQPSDGSV